VITVAGGTGNLGAALVSRLVARGFDVRVATRDPSRVVGRFAAEVEVTAMDVRDPATIARAIAHSRTVVSAITGFGGTEAGGAAAIDRDGNRAIIAAANEHGVEHVVLLSVVQAAQDHPIELFRMKYAAEQELRASGLAWTIIRPTAYMETWVGLLGRPLLDTGRTRIFGAGTNPINFVSARDVAGLVECAVTDTRFRGQIVEIGGPEDITMNELVARFEAVTGASGTIDHVPVPVMRAMSVLLKPLKPILAAQIGAAAVMDRLDLRFDGVGARRDYPDVTSTTLEAMIRRDFGSVAAAG
jgi:uncharacterized protein YbjT (DUF2867 family)